ncbi:MAG: nucleotidyltransferase family protein [Clostridia bacterium]|nr:nucleotidyltransferase family protein [Clostridia bacterium]
MKTSVVICEFNPFHNGHALLASKARENGATHVVGIMSGNFVQRGEPAICPAGLRAAAALENGYDLIVELPAVYSVSGAAVFAGAGVRIADALGCADSLVFGSECGDVSLLTETANILKNKETDERIVKLLSVGVTYAAARESAVREVNLRCADVLTNPNDILAVEYIGALISAGSALTPEAVKREGSIHGGSETKGNIASSSEIRRRIGAGEDISAFVPSSPSQLTDNPVDMKKFETLALHTMRTVTAQALAECPDVSEGIENRLISAAQNASSLDELYSLAKTKRYTHARIRRIVLYALLGITKQDVSLPAPYIRLLGFNSRGAEIVRLMKESARLPVISKTADIKDADEAAKRVFDIQCRAGDVYSLLLQNPLPGGEEKRFTVIKKT